MQIQLIGRPEIRDNDGNIADVPGHQSWALLARLIMSERPLGRRQIAQELFGDADDPLGALRWCLAALRRALGSGTLQGDPVELKLPDDTTIDLHRLGDDGGATVEPAEFLEGVNPVSTPEFQTWLLIAREQVAGTLHDLFRRSAVDALARGRPDVAMENAERAVRTRPLDESGHILLVKALTVAGRTEAALRHVDATEKIFERELGVRPSGALHQAARAGVASAPKGVSEAALVNSLIKSGSAALAAGAVDAGVDCLRRAAARAEDSNDDQMIARAFRELGTALVHAIRGFDDEGAVMLQRAADSAVRIGDPKEAATAYRELGYVEALAGRRPSAAKYLGDALEHADGDDDALAGIHATIGFNLVDWGRHPDGLSHFEQSLAFARSSRNQRREIWALGIGGWGQIRAGNPARAETWLSQCARLCDETRWVAFQPWPQAMLFEARLAQGKADNSAAETLDQALALSAQICDPCWEAASARALALLRERQGDKDAAIEWLDHARVRCCSVTDMYAALLVQILSDRIRLFTAKGRHDDASETARELMSLAARTHADAYLASALAFLNTAS